MELNVCLVAPPDWERKSIDEICKKVTSGGTPSRTNRMFYTNGTVNWVKTKELGDGFLKATEELITEEALNASSAKLLPKNTILLAMYGATVGKLGILAEAMACNQACCALVVSDKYDRDYLFYQLLFHRAQLIGAATGAAQQNLSATQIKQFTLPFPNLHLQRLIGALLRALDDRIDLLKETNTTLEAIAQAIFKSWFVDFDPVHAKQQGVECAGIDKATADLFPSSFVQSELGLIPEGWQVVRVGDVVDCVGGGTPSTKTESFWKPEAHCWTTPKDLSGLTSPILIETDRKISELGLKKISSGLLDKGTLLLSSRAPIGYLAIAQCKVAINQGYIAITDRSKLPPTYMLFWCRIYMELIKGSANGSTFMEISKNVFRNLPLVFPAEEVIARFKFTVQPLFEKMASNVYTAATLSSVRDTLLPRLMSGKLDLSEIEEQLQGVA